MHKYILYILLLINSLNVYSQVGINTENPKATLDVAALADNLSSIDGIIPPILTGEQLQAKNNLYTPDLLGVIVYVTSPSPNVENSDDKTKNINKAGYYYFDGNYWISLNTEIKAGNGLNINDNSLELGGNLTAPTNLSNITETNKLTFNATGINAININDSLLSIDANKARIGLGTNKPAKTLDIEGTLRFSQNESDNKPSKLPYTTKPLYGNLNTGNITYAPSGFTNVVGGFRPGSSLVLKMLPITSSITRVRFICHIDKSNDTNNRLTNAYTYGDFTIIGRDSTNPIKFVEADIKGYDGKQREYSISDDTISWSNAGQGTTTLTLDQSTGELKIKNTASTFSYLFEFLGGIE